ncbi:NADH-quinone oxidoreductase subunit J [Kushneria phyllosphaerae]|uniref:NADH-quinone oxidoreductase subunit J n=1 Tax=Kushneria phyllosphaerae TaxID=2100822 RepID=A0A2R8CJ07_9GAMM|nr:NADH-quinone oxidoreductase subunit J [Kushneria phyllosphaerae]SPJ32734.1 NADH-quinone oxidoreductase subunit J [Kushneria phyllosphaerae]
MEIAFYLAALVAIVATFRVITHTNAVHALLYLIISLMAVAVVFYSLGAPFAAALEVIVYAGAIMVLFVFVVMMLNLGSQTAHQERSWLVPRIWIGPSIMAAILLAVLVFSFWHGGGLGTISGEELSAKEVGTQMFGPYLLAVELAAMLLLAALIAASHIGRNDEPQLERDMNEAVQRAPAGNDEGGQA